MSKPTQSLISKSDFLIKYFEKHPKEDTEWFNKNKMVAPCSCDGTLCNTDGKCLGWVVIGIGASSREMYAQHHKPENLIWDGDSQHWTTNVPTTGKQIYLLYFKVYDSAALYEVPFYLPDSMVANSHVKKGTHCVEMYLTEEENEKLYEYAFNSGWLKIIGEEMNGLQG